MKTPAQIKAEGRMPTQEEIQAFYDSIATPRESDGWFGSTQHIDKSFGRVRFILEHIEPGMSVLEAGCADGGVSQHVVEAVGADGFVCLIDISPAFVEKASGFVTDKFPYHDVLCQIADAAEYGTKRRFDVIVVMEILEHVPDPRKLVANLFGLLRKNAGKLLITVPFEVEDQLGEHIHEFSELDVMNIVGDATGLHVSTRTEGQTIFAVVDKEKVVPYVP